MRLIVESKFAVDVKYLKIDFSNDDVIYDEIREFLGNYDIGVLINNVGRAAGPLPYLDLVENEPQLAKDITRINVTSVVKVQLSATE